MTAGFVEDLLDEMSDIFCFLSQHISRYERYEPEVLEVAFFEGSHVLFLNLLKLFHILVGGIVGRLHHLVKVLRHSYSKSLVLVQIIVVNHELLLHLGKTVELKA